MERAGRRRSGGVTVHGVEHLNDEWACWAIWEADKATLQELDEHWTWADVMDAHDVMHALAEARKAAKS